MIDLLIVTAFVLYAIGSGLRARRQASSGPEEYFLAGRSLPGWKSGMSMAATQFAADTPLLVVGLVATAGVFSLWRLWIYAIAFLLMAFVLSGPWRRSGVLTDAELTEIRYGGRGALPLRVMKAVYFGTVVNCAVLAMVMVAAVRIAEVCLLWHLWLPAGLYGAVIELVGVAGINLGASVTGLPPETATANGLISILLILAFTAGYSITGGLRSVVDTDVVQLSIAMLGTAIYAWFVVDAAGGLDGLADRVADLYGAERAAQLLSFSPGGAGDLLLPSLVVIGLQWLFQMNSDGTGYLAQRTMACRSDQEARWAGVLFTWLQILVRSLIWLAIAAGLLVLYPFTPEQAAAEGFAGSREILYVTGIDDLMPGGLRGLVLTGLLAALASTVDTHINWGASYWSNDVYGRLICREWLRRAPGNRELVVVARLSGALIVLLSILVMTQLDSIQAAWSISLLFGAGMGSVLVLRWLWERINVYAEFAAIAVSLVAAPLLLALLGTDPRDEWLRLGSMALVTTVAAIGAALLMPRTDDAVLTAFYRRVRPVGFWGRTARLVGQSSAVPLRALGRRLFSVVVSAASLFLLLIGIGRLMLSPPETAQGWSWAMLVVGCLLLPICWIETVRGDRAAATPP